MPASPQEHAVRPYDAFSIAYRAAGFNRFSEELATQLALDWKGVLPHRSRIADLGAGSGAARRPFEKQGFSVVALDLSASMLALGKGMRVQADMRSLPLLTGAFHGVVCLYDAINHLPRSDIGGFFQEAARLLPENGRMVFDANTESGAQLWIDTVCHIKRPGVTLEISTAYDGETGLMENSVSGWVVQPWGRLPVHETIVEWFHSREQLEGAYDAAGLSLVKVDDICMDSDRPNEASKWLYELVKT